MYLVIQVIAYFLCISFLALVDIGEKYKYRSIIFSILVVFLIFITGFRDGNIVRDYGTYKGIYEHGNNYLEPSFLIFRYIFKYILNLKIEWLMLFYALLAISIKVIAIKELTRYWYLSLMVFVCDLLLLHEFTQIRVAVAVSFLLLSIKYIYSREKMKFALCCIFAIFFHISALIIVPLWFFNTKKINLKLCFFIIFLGYIIAIIKFNPLKLLYYIPVPYIKNRVYYYLTQIDNKITTNIFSLFFIMKIFLFSILLLKHKIIIQYNKYSYIFLKIQLFSIISLLIFSQNIAASSRISDLYSGVEILLFPLLPVVIKEKETARMILFFICVLIICIRIFKQNLIII